MRKIVAGALVAALVAGVGAVSYWAGSRSSEPRPAAASTAPKGPPPGIVVEASRVQVVSLPQAITAVGSLRSDETIIVRPEIAGRVSRIDFREGERVSKDAILVKLDDSVQQADLDRARANLKLSKTKHERAIDLEGDAIDGTGGFRRVAEIGDCSRESGSLAGRGVGRRPSDLGDE